MASVAERLKELRVQTGKKQTEIASLLNVQPRAIRFYESGERKTNIEAIKKLSKYFEV